MLNNNNTPFKLCDKNNINEYIKDNPSYIIIIIIKYYYNTVLNKKIFFFYFPLTVIESYNR
jgi:hypothetical protein